MAEWTKAVDSKSTVAQVTEGSNPSLSASSATPSGEMTEWPKVHDWKSCVGQPTEGSNPSLSATFPLFGPRADQGGVGRSSEGRVLWTASCELRQVREEATVAVIAGLQGCPALSPSTDNARWLL